MKVLIVDDEPLARERLRRLLGTLPGMECVGEAGNGLEALRQTQTLSPDTVLMDIRMPGMDGLEAAGHLSGLPSAPAIIFITAFGDYAVQAFEAQAVDYVLKPVRVERLAKALDRARRLSPQQLASVSVAEPARARTHLSATLHGELRVIPLTEVLFFQADQKYITVRHRQGEMLLEESLKNLEEEFGASFVRIHRSALVARHAIEALEGDGEGHFYVRIAGVNERLEVSRRHAPEVRQLLRSGRLG